jgi:hypothetical protein
VSLHRLILFCTWFYGHSVEEPARFLHFHADERLHDRCAFCLGAIDHASEYIADWDTVGATCAPPPGSGLLTRNELAWFELGGRPFHGEVFFFDEEGLDDPTEWAVSFAVCSESCNLLFRLLARADRARAITAPELEDELRVTDCLADAEGLLFEAHMDRLARAKAHPLPSVDADFREAYDRLDFWIGLHLLSASSACAWCTKPLDSSLVVVFIHVDGDHTRRTRPVITSVRVADRLVPAWLTSPPEVEPPRLGIVVCGKSCRQAVERAVTGRALGLH